MTNSRLAEGDRAPKHRQTRRRELWPERDLLLRMEEQSRETSEVYASRFLS